MAKTGADLVTIMRNVTGRLDSSDPMFTDQVMLGYASDFAQLEMSQELRIIEQETWWEFTIDETTVNPLPVDLQDLGFTTIGPLCYANGFRVFWYQDPGQFFWRWPETQDYQPTRPTYVLYYNNELLFRAPPDQQYQIKIQAYAVELEIELGEEIERDYLWRYIAYGASLDLLNDFGEQDIAARVYPKFMDYKAKVYARTYQQQMNQRSTPRF